MLKLTFVVKFMLTFFHVEYVDRYIVGLVDEYLSVYAFSLFFVIFLE